MSHFTQSWPISTHPSLSCLSRNNIYTRPFSAFLKFHQPPLDHSPYLTSPPTRDSHHFGSTPFTLFYPTPTQLRSTAHASTFTPSCTQQDKMRTSLTFLTLLAAASSAVAAPLPAHEAGSGAVQKIVSSHRRSDSRVVVDMQEHLVS